jgi:hypothetical protein
MTAALTERNFHFEHREGIPGDRAAAEERNGGRGLLPAEAASSQLSSKSQAR